MTLDLFGVIVHEPDVSLTDLALFVVAIVCARRLAACPAGPLRLSSICMMVGLASASLWGAVYHGLFPAGPQTLAGQAIWTVVVCSIVAVGAFMIDLTLTVSGVITSGIGRRAVSAAYAAVAITTIVLRGSPFSAVVAFYVPIVIALLVVSVWRSTRDSDGRWAIVSAGLALTLVAGLIQQTGLSIHPLYFNHNALYHVVQGVAIILVSLGLMRLMSRPA